MRGVKTAAWLLIAGVMLSLCFWWPGVAGAVSLNTSYQVQRDVTYGAIDGVSLQMDVYHSHDIQAPTPAVIYIHGGGWYSGDKTGGPGIYDIPELVAHGYLVASIDYRLAPRYMFPAQIEDVNSAIRYLRANAGYYNINPASIGVFGDSAGGYLAALAGTADDRSGFWGSREGQRPSERVQAVVDMFGPADLTLFYQQNFSMNIEHVFGTDDPLSPVIQRASPITYVSADDPPFLILHGDSDSEVQLEQSVLLCHCLEAAGVPVNLTVVSHCGHGFKPVNGTMSPDRGEITRLVIGFFDKYLKRP